MEWRPLGEYEAFADWSGHPRSGGRAELEADVLERLVREVHEAEAAIAGYQEMLAIAQRQGMTYEQEWVPGQIARLQVTVNEIVVLWPEAATAEPATSAV